MSVAHPALSVIPRPLDAGHACTHGRCSTRAGRVLQQGDERLRAVAAGGAPRSGRSPPTPCASSRSTLPPLPQTAIAAAATYALEDRLATSGDDAVVVVGPRARAEGRVIAIVVARELVDALLAATPRVLHERSPSRSSRQPVDGWRWCESPNQRLRAHRGRRRVLGEPRRDARPAAGARASARPGNARAARARARRRRPRRRRRDARSLAGRNRRRVSSPAQPWRWEDARAGGLRGGDRRPRSVRQCVGDAVPAPSRGVLHLRCARGIAARRCTSSPRSARGLWQRASLARTSQATRAARARGRRTQRNARAMQRRRLPRCHADARHRAGLARAERRDAGARARCAGARVACRPVTLRTANWTAGAWTLELGPLDDATLSGIRRSAFRRPDCRRCMRRPASGVRVRVTSSAMTIAGAPARMLVERLDARARARRRRDAGRRGCDSLTRSCGNR